MFKVVLTSSIAAIADSVSPEISITESNWNLESTLEKNPHFLSLKLAEEAAWQLVDQLPKENKFTLVTINVSFLCCIRMFNRYLSLCVWLVSVPFTSHRRLSFDYDASLNLCFIARFLPQRNGLWWQ